MIGLLSALRSPKAFIPAMVLFGLVVAFWLHGQAQYKAGVMNTVSKFQQADLKGAENVQEIAKQVLSDTAGISDDDATRLLDATGGLRQHP